MFKRRTPRGIKKHLKEALWPTMGWGRTYHYFRHRLFRQQGSTYRITAGLATGAAISFTPFLGTHFLQAVFFSWLLKVNVVAGIIGTAWGNPWTFPFLFWTSYTVGVLMCGLFGFGDFVALPDTLSAGGFLAYMFANPLRFLLPMTLGGYVCAAFFWPFAYAVLYYPVRSARKTYRLQKIKRIRKRKERKSGA